MERTAAVVQSIVFVPLLILISPKATAWEDRLEDDWSCVLPFERTEEREPCADFNPLGNVYFGDLHNHSSYSFDAVIFGVANDPRDAYRFARGEEVGLQPYVDGEPARTVQLLRPLDFSALTDHSEYFAEVRICQTCRPGIDDCLECLAQGTATPSCQAQFVNNSRACKLFRASMAAAEQKPADLDLVDLGFVLWSQPALLSTSPERFPWCGDQGFDCLAVAADVWSDLQAVAEEAYDRTSECRFTSFIAYEWTGTPRFNNWHRNVIFRNERVPGLATSNLDTGPATMDASNVQQLWDDLEMQCRQSTPGCDVLTIPHNANISGGGLFRTPSSTDEAANQAEWEPLTEIHQIKGNSECRWGVGSQDELCRFELVSTTTFDAPAAGPQLAAPGSGAAPMPAPLQGFPLNARTRTHNNFIREVLKAGLVLGQTEDEGGVGVNPFKLGFAGGTDQHNGIPGATQTLVRDGPPGTRRQLDYPGHTGVKDDTIPKRLSQGQPSHTELEYNPGGLTAIWAPENSRDALFTALRRKEVYATSGTRPAVRFFGGWNYPRDLCDRHDFVTAGYAAGVPMGSDLEAPADAGEVPRFAVQATKDPGTSDYPGSQLERIQIVKGWLAADGTLHEQVFDVAGGDRRAEVDLATCEPHGSGYGSLCAVWQDPEFDPTQPAFYYARVLENPTCRWSTRQCHQLLRSDPGNGCWERLRTPANCDNPRPDPDGKIVCGNPQEAGVLVGYTVQQRAWTSPIWYQPESDGP